MAVSNKREAQYQSVDPWLIAVSVMLATFMEVLDNAIASVALTYIAQSPFEAYRQETACHGHPSD